MMEFLYNNLKVICSHGSIGMVGLVQQHEKEGVNSKVLYLNYLGIRYRLSALVA